MSQCNVHEIISDLIMEHCYIVYSEHNALIIDPGDAYEKIVKFLKQKNLKPLAVFLTHGHFDHCFCCKRLQKDGIKIYIHELDEDKLHSDGNLASAFGLKFDELYADKKLNEGHINIGEFDVEVIHTPGHSEGSVCYVIGNHFFSGDTFFENGVGRTDFYDGSMLKLRQSLRKLEQYLRKPYIFHYGH